MKGSVTTVSKGSKAPSRYTLPKPSLMKRQPRDPAGMVTRSPLSTKFYNAKAMTSPQTDVRGAYRTSNGGR